MTQPIGPMRQALELAWTSFVAGSFGIGAVAVDAAGEVLATGRNRILESEPGDDVLAGSSLAHAEMNVLAKLGYRRHDGADVILHTTLQPCLQCLGAVRLSSVSRIVVLAPDPLWRGLDRLLLDNEFVANNWPDSEELPVSTWSAFSLLLPTYRALALGRPATGWRDGVPLLTGLAETLLASGELASAADEGMAVDEVVAALHARLAACVPELAVLAGM
jgi:tRNA(Arg) A34 adenosine deaminase TadA